MSDLPEILPPGDSSVAIPIDDDRGELTDTVTIPVIVDNFRNAPTETLTPIGSAVATELTGSDLVSCPECGTSAMVTLNRRDAHDFCRNCDYPLFWTPNAIVRDGNGFTSGESLRRLPGTLGRATVAFTPCPHCAEPNTITAVTCVRCHLPMVIVEALPEPVPVYVPPPPEPEPEPEARGVPWWVWALLAAGAVITITLIVLALTGVFS